VIDRAADSPFRTIHANAWADPVDVPTLNAAASDLILRRIDEIRRAGRRRVDRLSSACILLLGPAGSGKTHLFARLRKLVRGRAAFIHTRPQIGVEPSPRFVLSSIIESLKQPVSNDDHLQLDVVAGAILAAHEGGDAQHWPLLEVENARNLVDAERRILIDRCVAGVEDRFPDIAPEYLERLLQVPFASRQDRRALLAWLGGREPSAVDLERIGAQGALADLDVMRALATLTVAAAYGAPVVLVFDQLENLAEDGGRTERIHAHARLVSDLRDTVSGLVIVQMALEAEWVTRIHPALQSADRDRLEETVLHLALPTPDERLQLLQRWCEALPEHDRTMPFPHPFRPEDVEAWVKRVGMTPRMLMQAAHEAYLGGEDGPGQSAVRADPGERLQARWEGGLAQARREIDEASRQQRGAPAERLAGGLLAALELSGAVAETVATKSGPLLRVANVADRRASHAAGAEVVFAQHGHPRSLAAAIRAAASRAGAARVLVMRERALAIPPTWREVEGSLKSLTSQPTTRFLSVNREDVARLLALEWFVTAARSHDLTADDGVAIPQAEVLEWARRTLGCAGWPPISATLGSPSPEPEEPGVEPPRTPPVAPSGAARAEGTAHLVLQRLGVASIERVVREAKALDATVTRATAVAELRRLGVRFFGESVVAAKELGP
jgi:hypothetical protein